MKIHYSRKMVGGVALLLGLLGFATLTPAPAVAGTLSTSVIGMFPKETGEFAYADMKSARSFPWFPQLRDQMIPSHFRDFEKFLANAGIDPSTEVDEVAWGAIVDPKAGEQIVGVALGTFSPEGTEQRFKQQKLPMIDVHGYHLWSFGSGTGPSDILFFFVDSNTAAFGNRQSLEKMIDVRYGGSQSLLDNSSLFPLINEANSAGGIVWAVLNEHYTNMGMQQLLPQANEFPQAAAIIQRLHAMEINIQGNSSLNAHFQAICGSPDDANTMAAALQAGVMYRRYQESQSNPALASALDGVKITPSGDRLTVDIPFSQDQIGALLKSGTFAIKM